MEYFVGIDIGATNTRVAIVNAQGKILKIKRFASVMAEGESFFQEVGTTAQQIAEEYGASAIGVGSAGQIERKTGVYLPGLYPDAPWVGIPLKDLIAEITGLPTFVDNDCKISAYAELKIGQGQGIGDFVSLTLGTGLGGGIISNGQLVHGAKGVAGHVGHLSVNPEGIPCLCGNRGCLELYVSGTAIAKEASKVFERQISSPQVFQMASEGNLLATAVVNNAAEYLGRGLGVLANLLNPELFILGGGILEWYTLMEETVNQSFQASCMKGLQTTSILTSKLGGNGGIIGAALYARDQL